MNFFQKMFIATTISLFTSSAFSTSLDFRHEYKVGSKQHASRVKMSHSFENNLSVGLETKFKGAEGKFMSEMQTNGTEIGINYKQKINNEWTLALGMPIEFGLSGDTYKPQIRLTYAPKYIDSLSISGRYRMDIKPGEDESRLRHRYTVNLGYKIDNWRFGYEGNYYYADSPSRNLYNGRTNYEHNVTIQYRIEAWTPWVEIGNSSASASSLDQEEDGRELRIRFGLRYSF
ncbi:MAG: oligogalacturonate-specific porin KdgM family protein [Shewanella sp.]